MRSRKLMKLITSIFCLLSFSYAHASPNLSNFITEVDYPSPNQNTVEGRKLYDVDLKLYCESLNVNSTESGIGTSIKKFNLKDNLCDNVRKLSQEGYYCKTQIFADPKTIGGEVTAFIDFDYIDYL
jgi:hypothetical protein